MSDEGSKWPGIVIGAAAALIGAGVGFGGSIFSATVAVSATDALSRGNNCIQYQAWVVDRIKDGMSDSAIATLSLAAVEAGTQRETMTPYAASPSTSPQTTVQTTHYYGPCGYIAGQEIRAMVHQIRIAMAPASRR